MSRRPSTPPVAYRYQQLMDDLNQLCAAAKIHLHFQEVIENGGNSLSTEEAKRLVTGHPKPTVKEIDALQARINYVLRLDSEPLRKQRP